MITDIIQGLNSNHKVQREKMIRRIREICSQYLNLFYIIVKEMVGKVVKNESF